MPTYVRLCVFKARRVYIYNSSPGRVAEAQSKSQQPPRFLRRMHEPRNSTRKNVAMGYDIWKGETTLINGSVTHKLQSHGV